MLRALVRHSRPGNKRWGHREQGPKTRVWDPAEHLVTEEDMAAYLEAALQEGDSALIAAALGDIARQGHESDCPRRRAGTGEPL